MTFIVSLAHFCEVHGPSMIMCTQVVNNLANLKDYYSPELSESQFCQSCMFKIPNKEKPGEEEEDDDDEDTASSLSTVNGSTETTVSSKIAVNDNENVNRSSLTLEDQISTLLNNQSISQQQRKRIMTLRTKSTEYPDTYFVSTQFPTNTEIYSSLRQTIVRVFTTETMTESNKPITFGNSKHGYSIALTFSLTDKTARGSERKYLVIVTTNWEVDLFNNYTFILTNLNQLIRNIYKIAKTKQNSGIQADLNSDLQNNDIYLRRSAGLPKAKSIVEILNDENFFVKIHVWASYMLNALENNKHM